MEDVMRLLEAGEMDEIVSITEIASSRVARQGSWPSHIDAKKSLVSRIPKETGKAPGFDAGIACALDLIPRDKQCLSAILHAAYTHEAVEQVRREFKLSDAKFADTETCWWLAACYYRDEGNVGICDFENQIKDFSALADDLDVRVDVARVEYAKMTNLYLLIDGVPVTIADGGLQGAYINGYKWGVQPAPQYGLFLIGTLKASLELEDFVWSNKIDDEGRPMSGLVHGMKNLVKASTFDELARVVARVRENLGEP